MTFHPEAFGKYYLVDKIAVGGMAEIFKAKQFGPGGFEKVLVIKRILSHLSEDPDFVKMFHDEAMISSKLSHSNIVHVYEFGKIRNNYFLAMEYCEGKDLKTVMKKCQELGRPLPIEYAAYVIHEVCKGLDYAHRKRDETDQEMNILHRDISPSNIMISYDEGEVKIADFGIAKAQDATYHTKAGVLKGKFEYMSPEQASGLPVDRRADIYACGIVFYEMLTRRRLFKTDSDARTLELIRNPWIPPPSHLNPQVTEDIDAIVMKALARDPEQRYQEAWQMQHDLREYMRSSTPPSSPDLIALSLANFMREIFAQEIRRERARLEAGTRVARELMVSRGESTDEFELDDAWDIPSRDGPESASTDTGSTDVRLLIEERERMSSHRHLVTVIVMTVIVVLGGLFVYRGMSSREEPGHPNADAMASGSAPVPRARTPSAQATLSVRSIPPGATVFLDGRRVGETPLVSADIPTGDVVELRLEMDGYQSYADAFYVPAGTERLERTATLKAVAPPAPAGPVAVPRPQPPATSSEQAPAQVNTVQRPAPTGRLSLKSAPAGAKVSIDGKTVCTTPCVFSRGRPGTRYTLLFDLPGYESVKTSAVFPPSGEKPVAVRLAVAQPGYLTITVKDNLSAEVIVDGKPLGEPRAFYERIPLPPGRRTVVLRNQVGGYEKTLHVDIAPGKETKQLNVDLSK